jgi:sugar/nucleoside kinase (ribokinase family)
MPTDAEQTAAPVDALFVGPVYCDLVFAGLPRLPQRGDEVYADEFVFSPGGTATRAVAASRLGLRTGLAAVVGEDLFGRLVVEFLRAEEGLDTTWLQADHRYRTSISASLVEGGDRSFVTFEQPELARPNADWPRDLPVARTCHLQVTEQLPGWTTDLRENGTVLFGGVGWDPTETWSPAVLDSLEGIDAFCPNDIEAIAYTRADSPRRAAELLAERVPLVVVTTGAGGAIGVDAGTGEVAAVPAPTTVALDPTGAGDVFVAALMTASLQPWTLAQRLRFSVLCASLSVTRCGGATSAPGWPDVSSFLERPGVDRGGDYTFLSDHIQRYVPAPTT